MVEGTAINPESIRVLGWLAFLCIGILIAFAFKGNDPRGS